MATINPAIIPIIPIVPSYDILPSLTYNLPMYSKANNNIMHQKQETIISSTCKREMLITSVFFRGIKNPSKKKSPT